MSLFNKVGILGSVFLLSSCAVATFPDFSDETEGRVLVAGEGLGSDADSDTLSTTHQSKITIAPEAVVSTNSKPEDTTDKKTSSGNEVRLMSDDEFAEQVDRIQAAKTTPVVTEEDLAEVSSREAPKPKSTKASTSFLSDDQYAEAERQYEAALSQAANPSEADAGPSVTYRLDTFYFSNGSAFLEEDYMIRIREIVKVAKENNAQIRVLGHASSRTRNTDIATHKLTNFKVSQERAEAVAKALRRAGLPSSQISVEALSDTAPAYLEVMPEGERLNRRAEVYISY